MTLRRHLWAKADECYQCRDCGDIQPVEPGYPTDDATCAGARPHDQAQMTNSRPGTPRISDPQLLEAFRKQCKFFGPGVALLVWQGQPGVLQDDLIDIAKEEGL